VNYIFLKLQCILYILKELVHIKYVKSLVNIVYIERTGAYYVCKIIGKHIILCILMSCNEYDNKKITIMILLKGMMLLLSLGLSILLLQLFMLVCNIHLKTVVCFLCCSSPSNRSIVIDVATRPTYMHDSISKSMCLSELAF
jgi:hypothetical protein